MELTEPEEADQKGVTTPACLFQNMCQFCDLLVVSKTILYLPGDLCQVDIPQNCNCKFYCIYTLMYIYIYTYICMYIYICICVCVCVSKPRNLCKLPRYLVAKPKPTSPSRFGSSSFTKMGFINTGFVC